MPCSRAGSESRLPPERNYRLVLGAQVASLLGDGIVPLALAFAVLEQTGSATGLGLVLASRVVAQVVCVLAGGVVADRVSRRRVMIAADLVRFGGQALLGALLVSGDAELWQVAVLQAVGGAASGFFNPASSGLLPQVVAASRLQQANALQALAKASGGIAGPVIAGILVATIGPGEAILADAASYALSAALLARVSVTEQRRAGSAFLAELRGGWRELTSRTWLWSTIAASSAMNLLHAGFFVLGPLVAMRDLGGAGAWATILATRAAGELAGGITMLRVRLRRPLLAAAAGAHLIGPPMLLLALGAPTPLIAGSTLLAGIGVVLFNTVLVTALQQRVPADAVSRVSAWDWLGSMTLQPLGFALVGPAADAFGLSATLGIAGLLHLLTASSVLLVIADRNGGATPRRAATAR